MINVNRVTLLGSLGAEPEGKTVNTSTVVNVSMATNRQWKDKATGETKQVTEWHKVVAWGLHADALIKFAHKGTKVYIEGFLSTRKYNKNGTDFYTTEVIVQGFDGKVIVLDKAERPATPSPQPQPQQTQFDDDEIPF